MKKLLEYDSIDSMTAVELPDRQVTCPFSVIFLDVTGLTVLSNNTVDIDISNVLNWTDFLNYIQINVCGNQASLLSVDLQAQVVYCKNNQSW